jgi:hypothetical protein
MKKLWIDDLRDPPDDTWVCARTSSEAISLLKSNRYDVISFDHDLGGDDTAMKIVDQIELWVYEETMPRFKWHIHSMNPIGRQNIARVLENIETVWYADEANNMMKPLPKDASLNQRLGEYLLEREVEIDDLQTKIKKLSARNAELEAALKEIADSTPDETTSTRNYWRHLCRIAQRALGV